jgi:hypothetical protein
MTASGRLVDIFAMTPDDVCASDIAHHLASTPRFGGATRFFYSVADHSIAVMRRAVLYQGVRTPESRPSLSPYALLHDAAEYLIGDIRRPVKMHPAFAPLRELECDIQAAILAHFGLAPPSEDAVALIKRADDDEMRHEAQWLMPAWEGWGPEVDGGLMLAPSIPREGPRAFLDALYSVLT